MKKKFRFRIQIKSKHLLAVMTFFCLACIIGGLAAGGGATPLQGLAGRIVVPFQRSISSLGELLKSAGHSFEEKQALLQENQDLKNQIEILTAENNKLIQDQEELTRLQELYALDQEYANYPKVAAMIISKDPGNWYSTFTIDKGEKDGIRVDNNVIAGKGLVGIVTQVGPNWATVRSIIDDSSYVSAMTVSTQDNCVVEGDLDLIDEGKLALTELYDAQGLVTAGERIVTSNISEKFVPGLFIGYVSEVAQDTNNLTKTGTIVTPVDFRHLKDVLVITVNKEDKISDAQ